MNEGFDLPPRDQLALVRGYIAQLESKRELIQSLWNRLQQTPDDEAVFNDLHLNVHRLAGSAGPYGLPALGAAAHALDRILASGARSSHPGKAAPRIDLASCAPRVIDLLNALKQAV